MIRQIAVRDVTAAKMLDMPTTKFRELVAKGLMPQPKRIADGIQRWNVEDLQQIVSGNAALPRRARFEA